MSPLLVVVCLEKEIWGKGPPMVKNRALPRMSDGLIADQRSNLPAISGREKQRPHLLTTLYQPTSIPRRDHLEIGGLIYRLVSFFL